MKTTSISAFAALAIAGALAASPAAARDQIRIVGSSTVFPYTQAVAEEFANATGNPAPVVESTGTGGGMKIFCGGVGTDHADITGASRAMKESEYKLCQENGVDSVTEVLIGFDGLSFAHAQGGRRSRLPRRSSSRPWPRRSPLTARSSTTPTRSGPRSIPRFRTSRSRSSARPRPPARATPGSNW